MAMPGCKRLPKRLPKGVPKRLPHGDRKVIAWVPQGDRIGQDDRMDPSR
ncbi:hypothetical protein [Adonisia turfae]|nr:hypothetical protein [Adonisia turfae]